MIATRTPFRMSFVGGGSDLKEFYNRQEGCVLSTTIDKYMYIFIHPYFDGRIQIKYSKTELVSKIEAIEHPIVREAMNRFQLNGVDINSIADIPAGTGLGSSSSFTVGLLHALYSYVGQTVDAERLAAEACEIEIDILNEPIGKQDQYAAAYGSLNVIRFQTDGTVRVEPVIMEPDYYQKLQNNLLMFYTGTTRSASGVLQDQKNNLINEQDRFDSLIQMTQLVEKASASLTSSDLVEFGNILDENWQLKKSLSNKISGSTIDDIYAIAKNNGAIGGKLLGAGGGGFLLFYCEAENHHRLRTALSSLREIRFNFDQGGSRRIKIYE